MDHRVHRKKYKSFMQYIVRGNLHHNKKGPFHAGVMGLVVVEQDRWVVVAQGPARRGLGALSYCTHYMRLHSIYLRNNT